MSVTLPKEAPAKIGNFVMVCLHNFFSCCVGRTDLVPLW